jgi:hypothetical protein
VDTQSLLKRCGINQHVCNGAIVPVNTGSVHTRLTFASL